MKGKTTIEAEPHWSKKPLKSEELDLILPTLRQARSAPTCSKCGGFKHVGACPKRKHGRRQ